MSEARKVGAYLPLRLGFVQRLTKWVPSRKKFCGISTISLIVSDIVWCSDVCVCVCVCVDREREGVLVGDGVEEEEVWGAVGSSDLWWLEAECPRRNLGQLWIGAPRQVQ